MAIFTDYSVLGAVVELGVVRAYPRSFRLALSPPVRECLASLPRLLGISAVLKSL